jgi:hypothetical protein
MTYRLQLYTRKFIWKEKKYIEPNEYNHELLWPYIV